MGDRKVVKSQNECCRQGDGDTFSPPSLHLNVYGSNLLKNRLTIPSMMTRNHISNIRIFTLFKGEHIQDWFGEAMRANGK